MKKQTMAQIVAAGLGIAALFGGCPNDTTASEKKKCECVNKVHGNAPCDCGGGDCTCKQATYSLSHGITLEDANGLLSSTQLGYFTKLITLYEKNQDFINKLDALESGVKIIVEPNSYTGCSRNGNEIKISIDSFTSVGDLQILDDKFLDIVTVSMETQGVTGGRFSKWEHRGAGRCFSVSQT